MSEASDLLGAALAAGDFGGDAQADLAFGVHGEDGAEGAGAVGVLYGSPEGLTFSANQLWTQDSSGVLDSAEPGDLFGYALAAANFGRTTHDDLAIGVRNESVESDGPITQAGAVNVLYGSTGGLASTGNQLWTQDSPSVPDSAESFDVFGSALAASNLGNTLEADLTIGVPNEDLGIDDVGAIHVLYGGSAGLNTVGTRYLSQNSPGVEDTAEEFDRLGKPLL